MSASLAVRTMPESQSLTRVHEVLDTFASHDATGEVLTAIRHFPAREAQWANFPSWVHADLVTAYASKSIHRLYSHQAAAAEAIHAGKNVVIVTPTASGKTLCYNLPVLDAVLKDSDSRALYLFPTKALAQDQLAELHDLNQRQSLRRFHLRRRYAKRRSQSDSRKRPHRAHQPGHAAHWNPAASHAMDALVRKSAVYRHR